MKIIFSSDVTFNESGDIKTQNNVQALSPSSSRDFIATLEANHFTADDITYLSSTENYTAPSSMHESSAEPDQNAKADEVQKYQADGNSPAVLRRSSRTSNLPNKWGFTGEVSLLTEISLLYADVSSSYSDAMSPENRAVWAPSIKKEENSLR